MRHLQTTLAIFLLTCSTAQGRQVEVDSTAFGRCSPGQASAVLDPGNVRVSVRNNGWLYDRDFEVPKGSGINASAYTSFSMVGEVGGERLAVNATRRNEFFPGPVALGVIPPSDCTPFDRIWTVGRDDVRHHPGALTDWPVAIDAPYVERGGGPGYQPMKGDVPLMFGDRQAWWIVNDAGNLHPRSESPRPLGVEARVSAFAFDLPGVLGNSTFFRIVVRNKNTLPIRQAHFGFQINGDLGNFTDDYVGTDTSAGMVFIYNADNVDEAGYGEGPPSVGYFLIEAPGREIEAPDCTAGPPDWHFDTTMERIGSAGVRGGAYGVDGILKAMTARWTQGAPLVEGGWGHESYGGDPTAPISYMYPGDPVTHSYWSELNTDRQNSANPASWRRIWASLGPFCLNSLEEAAFTLAIVWSRGSDHLDSVRQLRDDVAFVRSISDTILTPAPGGDVPVSPPSELAFNLYPSPATLQVHLEASVPIEVNLGVDVFDALGRPVWSRPKSDVGPGVWSRALDVTTWAPGLYIMRVTMAGRIFTKKLIVLR
ncbi:MAG: hypothetical protein ACI80V_001638 [Rhodothermales bacterium]|jgi:hypothetical protein